MTKLPLESLVEEQALPERVSQVGGTARERKEYNFVCPKGPCGTTFWLKLQFFTLARSPADLAYTLRQCLLLHQTLEAQICHSYFTGALGPRDPISQ